MTAERVNYSLNALWRFLINLGDNFKGIIMSIGFKDIADILIVAVFFYYAIKFLRDRRAGKLAFGVVLLFAIQIISDLFDFVALRFLLQNVFQIGLIAFVILFQPELRSALEKIGGGGGR